VVGALEGIEDEDDPDAGDLCLRCSAFEERKLPDRRRVASVEADRPAVLGEVGALELTVEPRAAVARELRAVVRRAPCDRGDGRIAARRGRSPGDRKDERAAEREETADFHVECPLLERP
jgi:hypothetical protein